MLPARLPNILLTAPPVLPSAWRPIFHRITCGSSSGGNRINRPAENHARSALDIVQGPDYPTEAEIITSRARSVKSTRTDVVQCVCARCGKRRWRGGYQRITASGFRCARLEQIAAQMRNKKLPMVDDLRMNLTTRTRPVW